jgi:N-acetylmuramic acid 6-phosphate (MurNAc-6-P) etherase
MRNDTQGSMSGGTEGRSEATRDIDRLSIENSLVPLANEFRSPFDASERSAAELAPVVRAVIGCARGGGHRAVSG